MSKIIGQDVLLVFIPLQTSEKFPRTEMRKSKTMKGQIWGVAGHYRNQSFLRLVGMWDRA